MSEPALFPALSFLCHCRELFITLTFLSSCLGLLSLGLSCYHTYAFLKEPICRAGYPAVHAPRTQVSLSRLQKAISYLGCFIANFLDAKTFQAVLLGESAWKDPWIFVLFMGMILRPILLVLAVAVLYDFGDNERGGPVSNREFWKLAGLYAGMLGVFVVLFLVFVGLDAVGFAMGQLFGALVSVRK